MKDPTLLELRRFAADVSGLIYVSPGVYQDTVRQTTHIDTWCPDSPDAPAWQLFGLRKSLEELYPDYCNWCIDSDYDQVIEGKPKYSCQVAVMKDGKSFTGEVYVVTVDEIPGGFLLAVWRAINGEGE